MKAVRGVALCLVLGLAVPVVAGAEQLAGKAVVIDGDTLEIEGRRVRLHGVDACETRQMAIFEGQAWPCGAVATAWLVERTLGQVTVCWGERWDRNERLLAVCSVAGVEINAEAVRSGVMVAYRLKGRAIDASYEDIEAEAKAGRRGLWGSAFDMPWDYRRKKRGG